jgi:hypothetical protein
VFDPSSGRRIRYETYCPNGPAPYSKTACEKLRTSWISIDEQEEIAEKAADTGSVTDSAQYIDNDDEWSDVVEFRSSGVADILLTGEVCTFELVLFLVLSSSLFSFFSTIGNSSYVLHRLLNSTVMLGATLLTLAG